MARKQVGSFQLTSDAVAPVAFGAVTNARVVVVKSIGGPMVARLTSAAGVTQSVPIDSLLILFCASAPITAIDLARSPGVQTEVRVYLGE